MHVSCSSISTWIVQYDVLAKAVVHRAHHTFIDTKCDLNNLTRIHAKDALLILVYIKLLNLLVNCGVSIRDLKSKHAVHAIIDKVLMLIVPHNKIVEIVNIRKLNRRFFSYGKLFNNLIFKAFLTVLKRDLFLLQKSRLNSIKRIKHRLILRLNTTLNMDTLLQRVRGRLPTQLSNKAHQVVCFALCQKL